MNAKKIKKQHGQEIGRGGVDRQVTAGKTLVEKIIFPPAWQSPQDSSQDRTQDQGGQKQSQGPGYSR